MNIYMVGLPSIKKGLAHYSELAATMSDKHTFYWYCAKIGEDVLKQYRQHIKFRVGIDRTSMIAEIKSKDVFVTCSQFENFPLPIGEAIMLRKPVFAYNIPEIASAFGGLIHLVERNNVDLMRQAIEGYYSAGVYDGDINKAYEHAYSTYSAGAVVDRVLAFIGAPQNSKTPSAFKR